jgi:hypothetical protein
VKYEKEVRFCLGVYLSGDGDNSSGHKLPPYNYTEKKIVSLDTQKELRDTAILHIQRMKKETSKSSAWTSST